MYYKKIIPHKCSRCKKQLYYKQDGFRNYVYLEKKKSYEYVCRDCFYKKQKVVINGI